MLANRYEADDEILWMKDEIIDCWEETYELSIFSRDHFFVVGTPENNFDCPIIATDNGPNKDKSFSPKVTIISSIPENVTLVGLGHSLLLRSFAIAVQKTAKSNVIPEEDYDSLHNNCGVYMLRLLKNLDIDFKSGDVYNKILDYSANTLAENKENVKEAIRGYKDGYPGYFGSIAIDVWHYIVGDKGVMRLAIKTVMEEE